MTYPDIRRAARVVHGHPSCAYGRGVVERVERAYGQAVVRFDDGATRRVMLRDLTPEPVDMPVCRVVWPIDSVVRADARQRIEDAMTGRGQ